MIKRTPLDAILSDLVRERADWTCEYCSAEFPERKGRGLHASHYIGRSNMSTRYDPDNLFSLCASCHRKLSDDHDEHYQFAYRSLGEVRYEVLRANKQKIKRYRKAELREMLAHYKEQQVILEGQRMAGEIGRLEFVAW